MYVLIFGHAGVLCLMGCFSSCADGELLSHCGVWASHVVDSCRAGAEGCEGFRVVVAPAL